MGLIYVTFPMSHSWERFTSLLNGVNSPILNLLKFIYIQMIYVLFIKSKLVFNEKCVNPPHVAIGTHLTNYY